MITFGHQIVSLVFASTKNNLDMKLGSIYQGVTWSTQAPREDPRHDYDSITCYEIENFTSVVA